MKSVQLFFADLPLGILPYLGMNSRFLFVPKINDFLNYEILSKNGKMDKNYKRLETSNAFFL